MHESGATLYVDIDPWLNPDQTLETLTNRSGAIVVADYKGTMRRRNLTESAYEWVRVATLDPVRWLKGTGTMSAFEVVLFPQDGAPS